MSIVAYGVARSAILLEPLVIGIHVIYFRSQEVAYHQSVALAVDGYGNARFVLEEIRTDSARPKSAPNSDFRDAFGAGVSRVDWYCPKFDNFACSHIHSSKNGPHR